MVLAVALSASVQVIVGTGASAVDLVAAGLVNPASVTDSDCEHGFESAEFDLPNRRPHIRAHNALVEGADVKIVRNGKTTFEGEVVIVDDGTEIHHVECAGLWEQCGRREDYSFGCIETDYSLFRVLDPKLDGTTHGHPSGYTIDTDGQLLICIPSGTTIKSGQAIKVALPVLEGLDPSITINAEFDISGAGPVSDNESFAYWVGTWYPWLKASSVYGTTLTQYADHVVLTGAAGDTTLSFMLMCGENVTLTADCYIQIRNLRIFVNRSSAPTPSAIVAEIAMPADNSLALASSVESLGSAVESFMGRPPTTRQAVIEQARALYTGIMDVGFWDGKTIHVRARPTAPDARRQHYCLSAQEYEWGIARDIENSVDAICCRYEYVPVNSISPSKPVSATGVWATDCPGWTRGSTAATAQDYGSSQFYWRLRATTTTNPTVTLTTGVSVAATARYLARCRSKVTARTSGDWYIDVFWYQDAACTTPSSTPYTPIRYGSRAEVTEAWHEAFITAPADAVAAKVGMGWQKHTTGSSEDLCVRDISLKPVTPSGTLKTVYYPSSPIAADARVAMLNLGTATDAEALSAVTQVCTYNGQPVSGSVTIDTPTVPTVDGAEVDAYHIRSWDWITCQDAVDTLDRGPFMISRVERSAEGVQVEIGGQYWQHPGFNHAAKIGKFIGAHRKLVHYSKRVAFSTYWRASHYRMVAYQSGVNKGKLHKVYDPLPARHPKYGYLPATKWVDVPGRYV